MRPALYVLLGLLLVPTVGLVGDIVTDGRFKSTMSTGAPLDVASSDTVVNLNADMVDGVEGTDLYTKAEVDALVAAATQRRRYYFDYTSCDGDEPLSVCNDGFHMANLFEIADPGALEYAYDEVGALSYGDMGFGPPTGIFGWIRTGRGAVTGEGVGSANCNAWTSDNPSHFGTLAELPGNWADPASSGLVALVWGTPWAAIDSDCAGQAFGVWCIED